MLTMSAHIYLKPVHIIQANIELLNPHIFMLFMHLYFYGILFPYYITKTMYFYDGCLKTIHRPLTAI